jgi:chloramphenicol O-acetyltransferase type A
MKTQINPQDTSRAEAFNLWLSSPMPMVTLTKTFDVTKILKASKKHKISFNALLCWCIGKTASQIEEFYLLVEKEKLYKYDKLAINVIVNNQKGGINSCDIAWSEDLKQFLKDYSHLTTLSIKENKSSFLEDYMIIGTSAMIQTEIDSIVNQYTDKFTNPMLMWGKYRKHFFKTLLPISFQFHHVQMDGGDGARFLELLQKELNLVY